MRAGYVCLNNCHVVITNTVYEQVGACSLLVLNEVNVNPGEQTLANERWQTNPGDECWIGFRLWSCYV